LIFKGLLFYDTFSSSWLQVFLEIGRLLMPI